MALANWPSDYRGLEGVALKSAGAITSTTNETAVTLGKGRYRLYVNITAIDDDAADDLYHILIQANTESATSTWYELTPKMCFGNSTATGDSTSDSTDTFDIIVDNPYDHQMRVRTIVKGTVTTGINYTVDAYQVLNQH